MEQIMAVVVLGLALFGLIELLAATVEAIRRALHGETRCLSCGTTRAKPREEVP